MSTRWLRLWSWDAVSCIWQSYAFIHMLRNFLWSCFLVPLTVLRLHFKHIHSTQNVAFIYTDFLERIQDENSWHQLPTAIYLQCVPKNHPQHFRLQLKEGSLDFNNFFIRIFLTQLAIKWPFNFPHHPTSASGKCRTKTSENIHNIIDCNLRKIIRFQ